MTFPQSNDDLLAHLDEEMEFLQDFGSAFDSGKQAYAKPLSTRIRLLVHDTGMSKSLLGQLGIKDRLRYVDTSRPVPAGLLLAHSGLAVIRATFGGDGSVETGYDAPLDSLGRQQPLPFDDWWQGAVLHDQEGNHFSRSDLVLGLADKDGGAHVDPEMEEAYARLARSNSLSWFASGPGGVIPAGNPVPANVRQVGFELDQTLREQLPALLGGSPTAVVPPPV